MAARSRACERAAADFAAVETGLVDANGFLNLRADADYGIERRHRLLKNHGDFAAAQRAHSLTLGGQEIVAGG